MGSSFLIEISIEIMILELGVIKIEEFSKRLISSFPEKFIPRLILNKQYFILQTRDKLMLKCRNDAIGVGYFNSE